MNPFEGRVERHRPPDAAWRAARGERLALARLEGIPITIDDAQLTREQVMARYADCFTWADVERKFPG